MIWMYVAYGILGTLAFCAIIFVIVMLLVSAYRSMYNIDVKVTIMTSGRAVVEMVKAKKTMADGIGDCYKIANKRFRNEKRDIIPYFGEGYCLPEIGKRRWFLAVTYDNGAYAPEEHVGKETVEVVDYINKEGEPVKKQVERHIVKPVKTSLRMVYLTITGYHQKEYGDTKGWWERNGDKVVSIALIMFTMIVCVVMLIFTYNLAQDILANDAPPWLNRLIAAISGAGGGQPPG